MVTQCPHSKLQVEGKKRNFGLARPWTWTLDWDFGLKHTVYLTLDSVVSVLTPKPYFGFRRQVHTSDVRIQTSRIRIRIRIQTPWIRIQTNPNPPLFSWIQIRIQIRIRLFEVWTRIRIQLKKPWIRIRIRTLLVHTLPYTLLIEGSLNVWTRAF